MIKYYTIPILFLIASILWIVFPPKNRNYFYGYRTSRSMKTAKSWYWGNYFFSRSLLITSIALLIIHSVAITIIDRPKKDIINVLMIGYFLIITCLIPITEIFLGIINKHYNHDKN